MPLLVAQERSPPPNDQHIIKIRAQKSARLAEKVESPLVDGGVRHETEMRGHIFNF